MKKILDYIDRSLIILCVIFICGVPDSITRQTLHPMDAIKAIIILGLIGFLAGAIGTRGLWVWIRGRG